MLQAFLLLLTGSPCCPSADALPAASLASAATDDPPVEVDPEVVATWLAELDALLESNSQEQVVQHLIAARGLPCENVLDAVDALLDRKERSGPIELVALDTLGFLELDQARERLHRRARSDRRIAEDDDLSAMLYKAIGRHRSVESIELLRDDLVVSGRPKTSKAKIFALGRIRSPLAVEAMIAEMNKLPTPEKGKSGIIPHGRDFRSALYALTGEDLGENRNPWQSWWNDNKRSLAVSAQEPELTGDAGEHWTRYWRVGKQDE